MQTFKIIIENYSEHILAQVPNYFGSLFLIRLLTSQVLLSIFYSYLKNFS